MELDHAFIACRPGGPEADSLLEQGFVEGSPNIHPGQGTANRRFFFENFKLELLWIVDRREATSERTRRTRLWERCSDLATPASPFGILFRAGAHAVPPPFPTWSYYPSFLPAGLAIEFAEGTTLQEPELVYLPFVRAAKPTSEPTNHRPPFHRLRSLAVGVQDLAALSQASLATQEREHLHCFKSEQPRLDLHFEGDGGTCVDLRPRLPLLFRADP